MRSEGQESSQRQRELDGCPTHPQHRGWEFRTDDGKIVQDSIGLANRTGLHKGRIQGDVLFLLLSFLISKPSVRLQHAVLAAREEM